MKTIRFKTNINCNNCIRAVSTFLDNERSIQRWTADTGHPQKLLTVEGDITALKVRELVARAGYQAEEIR